MRAKTISMGPFGIFNRVIFRQIAEKCGLYVHENKSLLSSNFRVTGNMNQLRNLKASLEILEQEEKRAQEMADFREKMFKQRWRWWKPNTWSMTAKAVWICLMLLMLIPVAAIIGVDLAASPHT